MDWEVAMFSEKVLRPDSKGRISLGKLAQGISSFRVTIDDRRRIVLEPYSEVPSSEKWLFDNPDVRESVLRGLVDAKNGRVSDLGSFAQYLDEAED